MIPEVHADQVLASGRLDPMVVQLHPEVAVAVAPERLVPMLAHAHLQLHPKVAHPYSNLCLTHVLDYVIIIKFESRHERAVAW